MRSKKNFPVSVITFLIAGSLLATASPAVAGNIEKVEGVSDSTASDSMINSPEQIEELLQAIDKIPEDVLLQGDIATQEWITANLGMQEGAAFRAGFLGCSGAILFAIGSTLIPAAKILKIKRYMNQLGGTAEAIKVLWGASFSHEKLKAAGGAAAALSAELLGIAAVKEACTS